MKKMISINFPEVRFRLTLSGKYTVVVGNSGTGKTHLARVCDDVYNGRATLNKLDMEVIGASVRTVTVLDPLLESKRGALFVIDESVLSAGGSAFIAKILESPNYFCSLQGVRHQAYPMAYKMYTTSKGMA